MRRREFLGLLGGAAAWPLAATAQQSAKVRKVGIFSAGSNSVPHLEAAFVAALHQLGWVEGTNIIFERRYAENQLNRLAGLAEELVNLNVDLIVTSGTLAPLAAKQATSTIPVVMMNAGDPVGTGLVSSLAHPGGNITGLTIMNPELGAKRLQLLKEAVPNLARIAVLWNSANPDPQRVFKEIERAGQELGIEVHSIEVRGPSDFAAAYKAVLRLQAKALITVADPLTVAHRKQIAEFATQNGLPSVHGLRQFADAGGLMAYGPDPADLRRRA